MADAWFESVAVAQKRAKRRLPKSVYGALIAGTERGQSMSDNEAAFTELGVGYVKREGDPSRYYDYWTQVFSRPSGEASPPGTYNASWC